MHFKIQFIYTTPNFIVAFTISLNFAINFILKVYITRVLKVFAFVTKRINLKIINNYLKFLEFPTFIAKVILLFIKLKLTLHNYFILLIRDSLNKLDMHFQDAYKLRYLNFYLLLQAPYFRILMILLYELNESDLKLYIQSIILIIFFN